jgi:hypothetical protein
MNDIIPYVTLAASYGVIVGFVLYNYFKAKREEEKNSEHK